MLTFLPGHICDSRAFSPQLAAFPGAWAIDGYGMANSLAEMARMVLSQADARGLEKLDLFGHSMGGRVAIEIVRLAPHRVGRLALVSTGIYPANAREAEARSDLQNFGYENGFEQLIDRWLPPLLAEPNRQSENFADLRAMCLSKSQALFDAHNDALLTRPPFDDLLAHITCPVLVMTGEFDSLAPPKQHAAIAEQVSDCELIIVEGAGHMLMREAPEEVNAAISRWMANAVDRV